MTSVSSDRRIGVNSGAAIKVPCKAASTVALTLSGEQTVDGVALVTGDRVLVKNQASGVDNGIYVVDTGTWSRAVDFDAAYDVVQGTLVAIVNGTVNSNTVWRISTSGTITIGTTSIAFSQALMTDSSVLYFLQGGAGAVARTAQSKMRQVIDVKDFGATGDGATNDYDAIALALTYANSIGASLYFPPGTYFYGTTIALTTSGVSLIGSAVGTGVKGTELKYTGNAIAITIDGLSFGGIRDMYLLGTAAATGGIKIGATTLAAQNEYKNLQITGFTQAGAYGIWVRQSIRDVFELVDLASNYYGMIIDGEGTGGADNSEVRTCQFLTNTLAGLKVRAGWAWKFYNCNFERNGTQGVLLQSGGNLAALLNISDFSFHGCWLESNGQTAGAADVYIDSPGAAIDTQRIQWHDTYCAQPVTVNFDLAKCDQVGLFNPRLLSWSYVTLSASAQNCYAFTSDNSAGNVGAGHLMCFGPSATQIQLLPQNSATPSVPFNHGQYFSNNNGATVITNFAGGSSGQVITVMIKDANTSIPDGASIKTQQGRTIVGLNSSATFSYDSTSALWREASRSDPVKQLLGSVFNAGDTGALIPNTDYGMLLITDRTAGKSALYSLNGALNTTTELADPDAGFQNATGGAVIAIYYDGAGTYRIKNEYAAAHTLSWTMFNQVTY